MIHHKPQIDDYSSIEKIRVSLGSAITLGLIDGFLNTNPTATYFLTYRKGKCAANCGFCSQAKDSKARKDMLSRVAWPVFATQKVFSKLAVVTQSGEIRRLCIQALNYSTVLADLLALVRKIRLRQVRAPISISCQPLQERDMELLAEVGVERIGIALDAATKEIFDKVKGRLAKGSYDWDKHREALLKAVELYGKGKVSTHLIVGLGETERDMVKVIQWCADNCITPALFAFTPIPGTSMEHNHPPDITCYRRIQLARYLIVQGEIKFAKMDFDTNGCIVSFGTSQQLLESTIQKGKPFLTSGCPNCNRPYYNEKPSGPLYNFPRQPTFREIQVIKSQLGTINCVRAH